MTTVKQERALEAERALERQLLRQNPGLSDGALDYLVREAKSKLEWSEYVDCGQALDVTALARAVIASDVGQMIFGGGEDEATTKAADHAKATAGMTRAQRIQYAREHQLD